MKGGATFNTILSRDDIRDMTGVGSSGDELKPNVYMSHRRLLAIKEIHKYMKNYGSEVGNLHAMLITLPEVHGEATIEYFPPVDNNYFKISFTKPYIYPHPLDIVNDGLKGIHKKDHHKGPLVLKDGVSPKTRIQQIASVKAVGAKGTLPNVLEQRIAAMAGIVPAAKESSSLTESQSSLAEDIAEEEKAEAIIDAGLEWVNAWNAAKSTKTKEAKELRSQTQIKFVELIRKHTSFFSPDSEDSLYSDGGRRKTRRSLRKKHKTRRR